MSSVTTPRGKRRHASLSIRTRDGAEHMRCGLTVARSDITRDWRAPDCQRCIARGGAESS